MSAPTTTPTSAAPTKQLHDLPNELALATFGEVVREGTFAITSTQHRIEKFRSNYKFSFISREFPALGSGQLAGAYREALGDYILKEARQIRVNVRDFNFTNFRALLTSLSDAGRLANFQMKDDGAFAERSFAVSHVATSKFPDTFEKLLNFNKFLAGLEKKLPGNGHLDIVYRVAECQDLQPVRRLLSKRTGLLELGKHFDTTLKYFLKYIAEEDLKQQAKRDADTAYWEELDAWIGNGAPSVDDVEAASHLHDEADRGNAGNGQAEGGALQSPTSDFEMEDASEMDIDEESEEEEDDQQQQLYIAPQPTQMAAQPAPDFSAFLGQPFAGGANPYMG